MLTVLPVICTVPDGPTAVAVTVCGPTLRALVNIWKLHPLLVKSILAKTLATSGRAPPNVAVPTLLPSTSTVTLCTGAPVAVSTAQPVTYSVAPLSTVATAPALPAVSTVPSRDPVITVVSVALAVTDPLADTDTEFTCGVDEFAATLTPTVIEG
jgi:hypothetical protein